MKIRVLAFATAGDAVGTGEMELTLPPGSHVRELKAELDHRFPGLQPLWTRLAIAVDGELVSEEASLVDGAEVALLPPVSGGSGHNPEDAPGASAAVALTHGAIDLEVLLARVQSPASGAVTLFIGHVRDQQEGRPVEKITYSAYRTMALEALQRIVDEIELRPGLKVAIHHRLGEVQVGEASVVIAVSSPHRVAAYEASRQALELLKQQVPIWKREHYRDGEAVWREEESLVDTGKTGPMPVYRLGET